MIRTALYALALSCLSVLPVSAGDSFASPVRGEILTGWRQPDGTRVAALRLTLAPGWKTYWRAPGDAGIPPQFDWSGSRNLRAVGISWPTPEVFLTAGMQTIGYSGTLVLPVTLSPRQPDAAIALDVDLDIGVCSDICVPHRMTLTAMIDGATTKPSPEIASALAAQPYSASEAGVAATRCTLTPTPEGLQIETRIDLPDTGGKEVVVIEPGQPGLWMSETRTNRQGGQLVATGTLRAEGGVPPMLDRSAIRITVLGKSRAVDIRGCTAG